MTIPHPLNQLMDDHEWILQVLDKMKKSSELLEKTGELKLREWKFFVRFCQEFTDGIHHQKEEGYLFPSLEEVSVAMQQGPIPCMLNEHEMGRNWVQKIDLALDEYEKNKNDSISKILTATSHYITLLRDHIYKENQILFRMAEQVLSLKEKQNLGAVFQQLSAREENVQCLGKLNQEFEFFN